MLHKLLFTCSVCCMCCFTFAGNAGSGDGFDSSDFLGLSVGVGALYSTQKVEVSKEVKATYDYLRLMWNKTGDEDIACYGDLAFTDTSYATEKVVKEWNSDIDAYKKALADMVLYESIKSVDIAVKDSPSRDPDFIFDKDDIAFKRFVRVVNKNIAVSRHSDVCGVNSNLTYRLANRGKFTFGAEVDCSFNSKGRKNIHVGLPANGTYKLYELEPFDEAGDERDEDKLKAATERGDISSLNRKELKLAEVGKAGSIMGMEHDSIIAGIYDNVTGGTILSSDSKDLAGTLLVNETGTFANASMNSKRECFTPSVGFVIGYRNSEKSLIEIGAGLTRVGVSFGLSGKNPIGDFVVLKGNMRKIVPSFKLSYTHKVSEKLSANIGVRYILKAKKNRIQVKDNLAVTAGFVWKVF